MTDIIRMALAAYPEYGKMLDEATRIKQEYVDCGGRPEHV